MTREEFERIANAQGSLDHQSWWSAEWGGFRNMLGLAVILRRWEGNVLSAQTTGETITISAARFFVLLARVKWRRWHGHKPEIPTARVLR